MNALSKRKSVNNLSLDNATRKNQDGKILHPEYIADWRANPKKLFQEKELKGILDEAVADLTDEYRLVFILRDIEGLSINESAKILDISQSNVKVRLLKARLFLRERLTKIFGDEGKRVFPSQHHRDAEHKATYHIL